MVSAKPGVGSAYTWTYRDANGDWLDPARTYHIIPIERRTDPPTA